MDKIPLKAWNQIISKKGGEVAQEVITASFNTRRWIAIYNLSHVEIRPWTYDFLKKVEYNYHDE